MPVHTISVQGGESVSEKWAAQSDLKFEVKIGGVM